METLSPLQHFIKLLSRVGKRQDHLQLIIFSDHEYSHSPLNLFTLFLIFPLKSNLSLNNFREFIVSDIPSQCSSETEVRTCSIQSVSGKPAGCLHNQKSTVQL